MGGLAIESASSSASSSAPTCLVGLRLAEFAQDFCLCGALPFASVGGASVGGASEIAPVAVEDARALFEALLARFGLGAAVSEMASAVGALLARFRLRGAAVAVVAVERVDVVVEGPAAEMSEAADAFAFLVLVLDGEGFEVAAAFGSILLSVTLSTNLHTSSELAANPSGRPLGGMIASSMPPC